MGNEEDENAPLAFLLVTCAGLSTCLGAAFVFEPRLVRLASKKFLAGSLGLSSGVMLYVSFVEILVKGQGAFENAGHSEKDAYTFATLGFFGGVAFYKLIGLVVHVLAGESHSHDAPLELLDLTSGEVVTSAAQQVEGQQHARDKGTSPPAVVMEMHHDNLAVTGNLTNLSLQLVGERERVQAAHNARVMSRKHGGGYGIGTANATGTATGAPYHSTSVVGAEEDFRVEEEEEAERKDTSSHPRQAAMVEEGEVVGSSKGIGGGGGGAEMESGTQLGRPSGSHQSDTASSTDTTDDNSSLQTADGDDKRLVKMGLMTAVAIGIHNFPEGLATFIAALTDPSVGVALAVAIAIHNIPEGLCVAIPVFYATGNRWKAFGWALLSGVSEPIGAGLGWLVLRNHMSETVYGLMFSLVGGMMTTIVVQELLPTAVRYDPQDKVVTNCFIVGMAIMALSLVLFLY